LLLDQALRIANGAPEGEPKVLLVAPASGHFATLLRGTVQTLLRDHDVYVTDWHNVRDIPLAAGPFDLDAFIEHIITFVDWLGPHTHLVAVCQPTPGFLQISAFMSMNIERHKESFRKMYGHFAAGETEKAVGIKEFYDEYLAMMDLPAEFYLQTVRKVFQEYHLPQGKLEYKGRLVRPELIRRTALFTVEGERDDICSIGQTLAAHDL
jgi:poly-beta-hydroxyalkanoate depolymerase